MAYADYQILAPGRPYGQSAEKSRCNEALSSFEVLLRSINDVESKEPGWDDICTMHGPDHLQIIPRIHHWCPSKEVDTRAQTAHHRLGIACGLLGISGSIIVDECFLDFAHAVALRAGRNGCFRKQLCLTRSFQSDEASSCLSDPSTCSERRPWLCVMTFLFLGPRYSTIRSPSSWVKTTPPKAG